jgi:DNA-binding transcriptional MerR regulator
VNDAISPTDARNPIGAARLIEVAENEEGYRGPQVCKVVGITYRQLDYWARTDLLRPSISEARGSGSQRRYSYRDLLHLKVIKRLLDSGISLQQARRALDCLRATGDDMATANLVIEEGRSVLVHSGEEIIDLLRGGQGVFNIVPMAPVYTELTAAITELRDGPGAGPVAGPAVRRAAGI